MATDYEAFYKQNPHGLGEPTKEFVDFFNAYSKATAKVLDIGCGQGRDALFIARLGHQVTAIDLSPTGIRDLTQDAEAEGLSIEGIVADIRYHDWQGSFDVVLLDRTLHMLPADEHLQVLEQLLNVTSDGSYVLISDEVSNMAGMVGVFETSSISWHVEYKKKGYLFMRR